MGRCCALACFSFSARCSSAWLMEVISRNRKQVSARATNLYRIYTPEGAPTWHQQVDVKVTLSHKDDTVSMVTFKYRLVIQMQSRIYGGRSAVIIRRVIRIVIGSVASLCCLPPPPRGFRNDPHHQAQISDRRYIQSHLHGNTPP